MVEKCNLGRGMASVTGPETAICLAQSRETQEGQYAWSSACQREHLGHVENFGFYSKHDNTGELCAKAIAAATVMLSFVSTGVDCGMIHSTNLTTISWVPTMCQVLL